jgi:hypoxanthine phosphoribosyltransferase
VSQRSPDGYTYKAENYCPDCIMSVMSGGKVVGSDVGYVYDVDKILKFCAAVMGIDYDDEYSYDSDEFPKPIFNTDEIEKCARYSHCFGSIG